MEMHADVHAEIDQPVTDKIEHRKSILGVSVSIEVESYRVFSLHETKGRVRIHSSDTRLHFRNSVLHRFVPRIDTHIEPSPPWRRAVTACTKACVLRTACCASRW